MNSAGSCRLHRCPPTRAAARKELRPGVGTTAFDLIGAAQSTDSRGRLDDLAAFAAGRRTIALATDRPRVAGRPRPRLCAAYSFGISRHIGSHSLHHKAVGSTFRPPARRNSYEGASPACSGPWLDHPATGRLRSDAGNEPSIATRPAGARQETLLVVAPPRHTMDGRCDGRPARRIPATVWVSPVAQPTLSSGWSDWRIRHMPST